MDSFAGVRYFCELASMNRERFMREALNQGVLIEKTALKEFTAGCGSALPQYTVTLPNGYRGFFVPRRGFPGGKMDGKVWYEWHGLGHPTALDIEHVPGCSCESCTQAPGL